MTSSLSIVREMAIAQIPPLGSFEVALFFLRAKGPADYLAQSIGLGARVDES